MRPRQYARQSRAYAVRSSEPLVNPDDRQQHGEGAEKKDGRRRGLQGASAAAGKGKVPPDCTGHRRVDLFNLLKTLRKRLSL